MRPSLSAAVDAGALRVRLLRLFASPGYQPPRLPAVALELLALSRRPKVEFDDALALLERDPIFAARVLSICQSAAYSRGRPVLSLRQAVVRLGLQGLRDLVVEAALHVRVFRAPGYEEPMARLARHSTAVARLIGSICVRARVDTEYAFLCGLLHDVGVAACLLALSDDARAQSIPFEVAAPIVQELHQEASALLARLWDLPPEIQRVVASHHQLSYGGSPSPVKAALLLSESLLVEQGLGLAPYDAQEDGEVTAARAFLGIDEATLATLRLEAAEVAANVG